MAGLAAVLGSGAMSNNIAGIVDNDALFVIGSNTTEAHPIIGQRMKKAVKRGAKLVVADPRRIPLVDYATLWLQHRPGTDAALINTICNIILENNLHDQKYIDERTENFEAFAASIKPCTPSWAEEITGVAAEDIIEAAKIYAQADCAGIYYTMGITQHTSGTNNVLTLANLALMTGNLGKAGAGLNPLRGQNNVQGSSDAACLPTLLPGYQKVDDDRARARFENLWNTSLPSKPGMTATEMTHAMLDGKLAGLWIMGENPLMSDPNTAHVREAFENLDFLVVQDIFLTETAEMADVVLPAASYAEKDGTFTNTERRVQRIRKAVEPPGTARDDLTIIDMISSRMQYGFNTIPSHSFESYRHGGESSFKAAHTTSAKNVFEEMGQAWPALAGITYDRIEHQGIQWPCPTTDHPGTPILFEDSFPRGKAKFSAIVWHAPNETPDSEYPLILSTGRVLQQYHTGTMTRRSDIIEAADRGAHVEINPSDAANLSIIEGEMVDAVSRRGKISLPAFITSRVNKGIVFIPFHYKEACANLLTNDALDPICKIPEAKVCAVRIEKQAFSF